VGTELAYGLIDFAKKQFGPIANTVLEHWGIYKTEDFGYIVYNLVDIGLIRKRENDSLEDFFNVLDIKEYFNSQECYSVDKTFIKTKKEA